MSPSPSLPRPRRLALRVLAATLVLAAVPLYAGPGTISFVSASTQLGEADGAVVVQLQRTGGTDGLVTVQVSSAPGTATSDVDYEANAATIVWQPDEGGTQTFSFALIQDSEPEGPETFYLTISDPQFGVAVGEPSTMTVTILDDDTSYPPCAADAETLCLRDDRFQVRVRWRNPPDFPDFQLAKVSDLGTSDSGLFYFQNPNNLEFLLKVLDACALNDRFWVFFAATTDVEFEVEVVDTARDVAVLYTNPQGNPADAVTDTAAFATCP